MDITTFVTNHPPYRPLSRKENYTRDRDIPALGFDGGNTITKASSREIMAWLKGRYEDQWRAIDAKRWSVDHWRIVRIGDAVRGELRLGFLEQQGPVQAPDEIEQEADRG